MPKVKWQDIPTMDWLYAELAGIVFRYHEKNGIVQRIYAYKKGWETFPLKKDTSHAGIIEEIKAQQDYIASPRFKQMIEMDYPISDSYLARHSQQYPDVTGWITVLYPYEKPSMKGAMARLKLLGRANYHQIIALSKLRQPVNVLGGSNHEYDYHIMVVSADGSVYRIQSSGAMDYWL